MAFGKCCFSFTTNTRCITSGRLSRKFNPSRTPAFPTEYHMIRQQTRESQAAPLLPVIITIVLRALFLLLLRTAWRVARCAGNNVVACVGVGNALRLFFVAFPGRWSLERVVGGSGLGQGGGARGSLVGSRLGCRRLGFVFIFIVVVPRDVLFVLCRRI